MIVPTQSVDLAVRADSSSSSSKASESNSCKGKNANSSACEKPVNEDGLEIGLGVGIPVFVILCILGFFVLKNYRKNKRESLERDPDFDENGEATALPDFPVFTKEDPFAGPQRGYPMMGANRSAQELSKFSTRNMDEGYDGFVLPYHHETGSKASLDEYAKQLMDKTDFRRDSAVHSRTYSHMNPGSLRESPQKSQLGATYTAGQNEPVGRLTHTDFGHANASSTLLGEDKFYNTQETFEDSQNGFDVKYENEPQMADDGIESVKDFSDSDNDETESEETVREERRIPSFDVSSPFDDRHDISTPDEDADAEDAAANTTAKTDTTADSADAPQGSKFVGAPEEADISGVSDASVAANTSGLSLKKSPRVSTLNAMKEDDENMSKEQEEQLARMKSVYQVYFDRSNSVKSEAHGGSFQPDTSQPLPQIDGLNKVNATLNADTDYAKRHTTASSVYDAVPVFPDEAEESSNAHPNGQRYPPQNGHPVQKGSYRAQNGYPQYPNGSNASPNGHPGYSNGSPSAYPGQTSPEETDSVPAELPPLKSLPHASDIRHSTIETFTDYVPRGKVTSPSLRFDSESTFSSPATKSTATFGPASGVPPVLHNPSTDSVPSPSQLARTSVVMLNPVSEIAPLRKYKPAGSLPSGPGSPSLASHNEWATSSDDLIPANRKSAVRRMMNTNF